MSGFSYTAFYDLDHTILKGNSATHLVFEARVPNALTGPDQVLNVVKRVEIPDGRHAVFLEHLGMQIDDITWTLTQRDHIYTTGQGL